MPKIMPIMMPESLTQGLLETLSAIIVTSTNRPRARFSMLPKLGLPNPPAKSVIPTFIRLIPIVVITIPVVNGVITLLILLINKLTIISMKAPIKQTPSRVESISSLLPPLALIDSPAINNALINAKLVPCTAIKPQPTGPKVFA